jgi:hypothetical protein
MTTAFVKPPLPGGSSHSHGLGSCDVRSVPETLSLACDLSVGLCRSRRTQMGQTLVQYLHAEHSRGVQPLEDVVHFNRIPGHAGLAAYVREPQLGAMENSRRAS